MKRTIAAGLSAALLCGMVVPAFAADTKTATNTTGTYHIMNLIDVDNGIAFLHGSLNAVRKSCFKEVL